jgi:hypothetical protein
MDKFNIDEVDLGLSLSMRLQLLVSYILQHQHIRTINISSKFIVHSELEDVVSIYANPSTYDCSDTEIKCCALCEKEEDAMYVRRNFKKQNKTFYYSLCFKCNDKGKVLCETSFTEKSICKKFWTDKAVCMQQFDNWMPNDVKRVIVGKMKDNGVCCL